MTKQELLNSAFYHISCIIMVGTDKEKFGSVSVRHMLHDCRAALAALQELDNQLAGNPPAKDDKI